MTESCKTHTHITFGVKNNHISKFVKHHYPFHEFLQHKLLKLAGIFNTHTLQLHNQNAENVTEKAFIKKTSLTDIVFG